MDKPLVAALSDSVGLHDFIAGGAKGPRDGATPGTGRDGVELVDFAAVGAKGAHEEAIGVLEALVHTARQALGPGRDGAALAADTDKLALVVASIAGIGAGVLVEWRHQR